MNMPNAQKKRLTRLEDKVEAVDEGVGLLYSRVADIEQKRQQLSDEVAYLKSQSMRNNLIFTEIEEYNSQGNEYQVVTERKLRVHLSEKLKIPK
ncbi:hypothetical protein DPMN_113409 [Dreissena polymorpha]|uniref:Uncharacterized protein n=1 Tax=Dreissena polymorpha TaxID=45954 RepID=A0A9D4QQT6_DREPO|nr:hypothetical protein DPMN_113409 [Dreissena polymorpha]